MPTKFDGYLVNHFLRTQSSSWRLYMEMILSFPDGYVMLYHKGVVDESMRGTRIKQHLGRMVSNRKRTHHHRLSLRYGFHLCMKNLSHLVCRFTPLCILPFLSHIFKLAELRLAGRRPLESGVILSRVGAFFREMPGFTTIIASVIVVRRGSRTNTWAFGWRGAVVMAVGRGKTYWPGRYCIGGKEPRKGGCAGKRLWLCG